MARKAIPTNSKLPSVRKRVPLSKSIIGVTIKNHRTSDGILLVGVNSDDAVEEVLPGQEISIGGFDGFVLDDTYFTIDWEEGTSIKKAYMLVVKDGGEICK